MTCAVRQPGTCYRRRFSVGNRRRSPVEACGDDGVESTGVRGDPASGAAVVKQNDKQNDAALLTVCNGILEGNRSRRCWSRWIRTDTHGPSRSSVCSADHPSSCATWTPVVVAELSADAALSAGSMAARRPVGAPAPGSRSDRCPTFPAWHVAVGHSTQAGRHRHGRLCRPRRVVMRPRRVLGLSGHLGCPIAAGRSRCASMDAPVTSRR